MPTMPSEDEVEAQLGMVFDELVELIGETQQAVWTASSPERRKVFNDLKLFIAEQARAIDEAEQRIGTRPPWIKSPSAHHPRNLAGEAAGDSDRLVQLLIQNLRAVIDDVNGRAGTLDGEWRSFLLGVAEQITQHVDAL
ncbi:MAG: hypothetical protein QOD39_3133 [Mycobacterium sp.]|nr:hypothetical protein [Mycobacterium sp.]